MMQFKSNYLARFLCSCLLAGFCLAIALSGSWTPVNSQVEDYQTKISQIETKQTHASQTKTGQTQNAQPKTYQTTKAFTQYRPNYKVILAHDTNYGDRYAQDVRGNPLANQPIAVLHETVGSASSALNLFRRANYRDSDQASYHTLITLDGTVIYIVPPEKRAFGAGNSAFRSATGTEAVQTNPNLAPSVNNFAYHVSLETPPDGRNNQRSHSGYTPAQYKSLAWLLAQSSIPDERITTHKEVDLSGTRLDPRSFDLPRLLNILHAYRQPT